MTDNIIELNYDLEPSVIQGHYGRSGHFEKINKYKNLQFVHCSDVHGSLKNWDRMVEYVNHYKDYISFVLQTGDYIDNNQQKYVDMYKEGKKCEKPIFNCVGNHDTYPDESWVTADKSVTHEFLFNHTDGWNVNFMDISNSMTYYMDFYEENIRFIVLDLYYDTKLQVKWLKEMLDRSMEEGLSVITAMHEPVAQLTDYIDTPFCSIDDHKAANGPMTNHPFEDPIADFIKNGGKYICNLCGHMHHDLFGYTESGILNIVVECGTNWFYHCDGTRVDGTRTFDAFNVMSVDVNRGILKLIRIGDNTDSFLRIKTTMCYDYINKKVIL